MDTNVSGKLYGNLWGANNETPKMNIYLVVLDLLCDISNEMNCSFIYQHNREELKGWVPKYCQGWAAASIHRRKPTTGRHGGFDLLRFRPGPVHLSLDDLVVPGSPRSTISIPNLVWTPVRHSELQPTNPRLIRSDNLSLPVTWITGTRQRARRDLRLQVCAMSWFHVTSSRMGYLFTFYSL